MTAPTIATATTPNIFPCLFYQDAPAAIDWLGRAFGFEQILVVPGPEGRIVHAELRLGPGTIMLGSAQPQRGFVSPRDLPAVNQSVCLYVEDPDAHHARAVAAGAVMVIDLATTDYGSREYTARDLEGHVWTFGTYRPAVA